MTKSLRQAELRLWFADQNPLTDDPRETSGIMQPTADGTVAFAEAIIRRHFDGVCDCQDEGKDMPKESARPDRTLEAHLRHLAGTCAGDDPEANAEQVAAHIAILEAELGQARAALKEELSSKLVVVEDSEILAARARRNRLSKTLRALESGREVKDG